MSEDERLWEAWKSNSRLTEVDQEVLVETELLREELDKIEQRVSRSANRISPVQGR